MHAPPPAEAVLSEAAAVPQTVVMSPQSVYSVGRQPQGQSE